MIALTLGQATENIIVTLDEKKTLSAGYYLFVFTHFTTKEVVNKIYNFLADDSAYQARFNQFAIATNTVFTGKPTGDWTYNVYEQASATNTTVTGLTEVERGIMRLKPAADFAFTQYAGTTTYKEYAG